MCSYEETETRVCPHEKLLCLHDGTEGRLSRWEVVILMKLVYVLMTGQKFVRPHDEKVVRLHEKREYSHDRTNNRGTKASLAMYENVG